jgi:NTE family protein
VSEPGAATAAGELCLALGGGGARGAYQVGVLRAVAERYPDLEVPLLTGVSAGSINAAHLANHPGGFREKVEALVELWSDLTIDQVFRASPWDLAGHLVRWGLELSLLGGRDQGEHVRGLVDTEPLTGFLERHLSCVDGRLCGIQRNLEAGRLRAVALPTTSYATGRTITWYEGRGVEPWERPNRRGAPCELRLEHVLASSALPFFFPAVEVEGQWYGDGGLRLTAPLAPAIHLGAGRILAVSTRYGRSTAEAAELDFQGYPPPAQIAGVLLNAIFLDLLDHDAAHLERVNDLLARLPAGEPAPFRRVGLFVVRPSVDIGRLARRYEPKLPRTFRFLTRRLGTQRSRTSDLLSLVMFEPGYLRRLMDIGERDARERIDELAAFLAGEGPQ